MTTATATQTNELTLEQIQQGIEHSRQVIAAWDEAVAALEPVATTKQATDPTAEVTKPERKMSSIEAIMPAWMLTGRTTNGAFSGRGSWR